MNLAAFQQSAFLQSLGWAIANSIWQGGMLWVFYQMLVSSYNDAPAKFKNNLSTVLIFCNFLWVVATFFIKIIHLRDYLPGGYTENSLANYPGADMVPADMSVENITAAIVISLPYLSLAYLVLLLIFSIKLVNSYRHTNFIKNNGLLRPEAEWRVFIDKVANHIGITVKIKIWFSKYVDVPATIGFFKPVILIPLASLNQLTAEQMEAIILHEISHIKRNDYLVNLLISLIETILFFNPFVVLFSKIIKKERENCCDDFVLQYQYDRHAYASALLVLEQSREQQFHLALAATSGRKQLLFRIKRIMEVKKHNDGLNYGQKLLALFLSTAIICSIAWLTPAKKTNPPSGKKLLAKVSLNITSAIVIKAKDSSSGLQYKKPAKNIVPVKTPVIGEGRVLDVPESGTSWQNQGEDVLVENNWQDNIARKEYHHALDNNNNLLILKSPSFLNETPGIVQNDLLFSANSLLSKLNFLKSLHFDIDINKLKESLEKENWAATSSEWINMNDQLNQAFEEVKAPKVTENIQKEFQANMFRQRSQEKIPRLKIPLNDSFYILNDNGRLDFSYYETPEGYAVPPPPLPLSRKKGIAPNLPQVQPPNPSYEYSFKYNTSPKIKLPPRSIRIDYKQGIIIVNGEKINLAELKSAQVEKIVKKLVKVDVDAESTE